VVKIETSEIRKERIHPLFPYGEEIAYKVCKLFHWDTVPKSKVLHQSAVQSLGTVEKIQKYGQMVECFKTIQGSKTFTFQTFVEGETLPNYKSEITQCPDVSSYQRAYLLWLILGKFDDRGDNVIFDPKTRKLYGIDNEYIGSKGYEKDGILNCFEDLKGLEIDPTILDDVLKVSEESLKKIQHKYLAKELDLLVLWAQETGPLHHNRQKTQNVDIVKTSVYDRKHVTAGHKNPLEILQARGLSYGPNSEFWNDCSIGKSTSLPISRSSSESKEESSSDEFFSDNSQDMIFNNFKLMHKKKLS